MSLEDHSNVERTLTNLPVHVEFESVTLNIRDLNRIQAGRAEFRIPEAKFITDLG